MILCVTKGELTCSMLCKPPAKASINRFGRLLVLLDLLQAGLRAQLSCVH